MNLLTGIKKISGLIAPHLAIGALATATGVSGALITLYLSLHGFKLELRKQDAELEALRAVKLDVSSASRVNIIKMLPDGKRLYYVTFTVNAKNDNDTNLLFSYQLFSANILRLDGGRLESKPGYLFDDPPDPFDGVEKDFPLKDAPDLIWKPIACAEHRYTSDKVLIKLLDGAGCTGWTDGGGMTGVYPPHSMNSYANGILVTARPGDFVGVSTAFGVADCSDEDGPNCSLSQDIVRLP